MKELHSVAFGKMLRELRKEKGYSQEAFAERAGIDRSYMGHIERGEKSITLTKIYQLTEALSMKPSEFFTRLERVDALSND